MAKTSSASASWRIRIPVFLLLLSCFILQPTVAQPIHLSIRETLQRVQTNLPQLEASRQRAAAEERNIELAKNSLVPEMNAGYQLGLATYNNITGMSYPGYMLPISGPPSTNNEMDFVPGTGAGALVKWNPFTFGQRNAAVQKATAQFKQANAAYNEQLFQAQYNALNLYLEALYLKQVAEISRAVMARNRVSLEQSLTLARTGLKPGIDTAQFQYILVQAEIDLLQTQKTYQQRIIELSRLTGITQNSENIVLTDSVFKLAVSNTDSVAVTAHPHYQLMEAQKQSTLAGLEEIKRAWRPQLDIWANLYARGSGIDASGVVNKTEGYSFSRTNAGVGLQLNFPVFQFTKINIRKKQYDLLLKADEARLAQAALDISKQVETAEWQYKQDLIIAGKTPLQLKIAKDVYSGLQISYEAGLIDYSRLYQSQYELTKAELNHAGAVLQLWRSLLGLAVAKGNLDIFSQPFN